jgi:hypothetical protein
VLRSVAQLLRRYHEAAAGFDVTAHRWDWVPPAPFDEGLACHNDLNLDNVIFRDHRAVAMIDFDLAVASRDGWRGTKCVGDVLDNHRAEIAPDIPGAVARDCRRREHG